MTPREKGELSPSTGDPSQCGHRPRVAGAEVAVQSIGGSHRGFPDCLRGRSGCGSEEELVGL